MPASRTWNETTAERHLPPPPLRGRVLLAAGCGCLAVAGLGLLTQSWFGTRSSQPLIAAAVFASTIGVAFGAMRNQHPFPRFGAANRVTMVRAMLVALVTSMIGEPPGARLVLAIVCTTAVIGALDGVDGWLARRSRMSSAFGARFDMETDAFFLMVLSVLVWQQHKAGPWVLAIGLMRYAFVAAGSVLPWLSKPLRSTRRGKTVAVCQLAALAVALAPVIPVPLSSAICAAAVTALAWSFAIDVGYLWRRRADLSCPRVNI
jgi:phosphatidylglycerophosphate synthase